jgi:predicted nucleic acid-binding protein
LVVVDASVLVRALGDDDAPGEIARRRLRDQSLVAPELIDIEFISAFRHQLDSGELAVPRALLAMVELRRMPIRRSTLQQSLLGVAGQPDAV